MTVLKGGTARLGRAQNRIAAVLLIAALAASGCSRKLEVPDGLEGAVDPTTEIGAGGDVCDLLTESEIQLALNAPAEKTTIGGRPVLIGMKMCDAAGQSRDDRVSKEDQKKGGEIGDAGSRARWGLITRSAAKGFAAYAERNKKYLDRFELNGHEAAWDSRLRTLSVLAEDKAFSVYLKIDEPPLPKEATSADRRAYERKVAELLALRALQRFD